jgi:hypothetical protein
VSNGSRAVIVDPRAALSADFHQINHESPESLKTRSY